MADNYRDNSTRLKVVIDDSLSVDGGCPRRQPDGEEAEEDFSSINPSADARVDINLHTSAFSDLLVTGYDQPLGDGHGTVVVARVNSRSQQQPRRLWDVVTEVQSATTPSSSRCCFDLQEDPNSRATGKS